MTDCPLLATLLVRGRPKLVDARERCAAWEPRKGGWCGAKFIDPERGCLKGPEEIETLLKQEGER